MWATQYIKQLLEGSEVEFRPRGNSMNPLIESGDLVVVRPIEDEEEINTKDIVLCKVKGKHYLHLVKAIQGNRYQISNNKGFVNGWISRNSVYGKLKENKGK